MFLHIQKSKMKFAYSKNFYYICAMNELTNDEKSHVQVARKIKEMGLEQGDILVYAVIKSYRNGETKRCNPSMDKEIVPKTGLPKRFVLASIIRLENAGLITVERKKGTSNKYTFTELDSKFDMYAKTFLNITNLKAHTKEFYMKIQEYLFVHEDGTGESTYNVSQLAELADVDWRSAKKYLEELEEKQYLEVRNSTSLDIAGFKGKQYVFDLNKLGQKILWALAKHEENIQDLYEKDAAKTKEIARLNKEVEELNNIIRINRLRTNEKRQPIDYGIYQNTDN